MDDNSNAIVLLSKNGRFWIFWGGQTLSKIGDHLHHIAIMWFVLDRTGSGPAIGGILLASSVPLVLLAPGAGEITDRFNRKWILVFADLVRALAACGIGVLAFQETINLFLLLILSALMACGTAFFQPSIHSLIPLIVRKEELLRANSINEGSTQASGILGPVLAGLLLSLFSPAMIFFVNALSFIAGAVSAIPIKTDVRASANERPRFLDGFSYLMKQSFLKEIVITFCILNFAVSFMEVYIPFLSTEGLGGGPKELGLIFTAIFTGAFVASMGLIIKKEIRRYGSVIAGGICTVGLSFTSVFFLRNLLPTLLCCLFVGIGWSIFNTNARVLIQKTVEDGKRGRVFAIMGAVSGIMMPAAYGLGGVATQVIAVYPAFLMGGTLVFLSGIYLFFSKGIKQQV